MPKMNPAEATKAINKIAKDDRFDLAFTKHVRERMDERSITIGDLLHLLKRGIVLVEGVSDERTENFWKYRIEGRTPSTGQRSIAAIVIPDTKWSIIKVVTVMWLDET